MKIELHHKYLCRITPRPEWRGHPLKPGAIAHIGEEHVFMASWRCLEGEKYPHEFAMHLVDDAVRRRFFDKDGIGWFASGDLTVIAEAEQ